MYMAVVGEDHSKLEEDTTFKIQKRFIKGQRLWLDELSIDYNQQDKLFYVDAYADKEKKECLGRFPKNWFAYALFSPEILIDIIQKGNWSDEVLYELQKLKDKEKSMEFLANLPDNKELVNSFFSDLKVKNRLGLK